MVIAICSQGPGIDSIVDKRFGRCAYFILVDPDNEQFESLHNHAQDAAGGAGVQAAQTLANKGIQAVLVKNIGPKAISVFNAGKIKIYTDVHGTVKETLQSYQQGSLKPLSEPTVSSHFGIGQGYGER